MNLIDAVVTEVKGNPYKYGDKWWVKVDANSMGRVSETDLMFKTEAEAWAIKVGYEFLT